MSTPSSVPRLGAVIDGTPLMAAARARLVASVFEIKHAILERNGTISIITHER